MESDPGGKEGAVTPGTMTESFDATLYGASPDGAQLSGKVYVADGEIVFSSPATTVSVPVNIAQIRVGGATGHTTFITNPAFPDQMIIVVSTTFQRHSQLAAHPSLTADVKRSRRRTTCCLGCGILFLVALAALIWALVSLRDPAVAWATDRIPYDLEAKFGQAALESMGSTAPLIADQPLQDLLKEFAEPVSRAVQELDTKARGGNVSPEFTLHVSAVDEPNAFALPGRIIVVNRGLINTARSADEVLGVIAHEMGHGVERHSLRGMVDRLGWQAIAVLVSGDPNSLSGMVLSGGAYVFSQKYSRTQERSADKWAIDALTKAGISPVGLVTFFQRLQHEHGDTPAALSFASTHPALSERIENISKSLPAQAPPPNPARDEQFKALQEMLKTP